MFRPRNDPSILREASDYGPAVGLTRQRSLQRGRKQHERWGWLIMHAFKGNRSPTWSGYDKDASRG